MLNKKIFSVKSHKKLLFALQSGKKALRQEELTANRFFSLFHLKDCIA
jgi:hypothetical protein